MSPENSPKKSRPSAQERIAVRRAADLAERARQNRRRQIRVVGLPILVIVLLVGALVVGKVVSGSGSPKSGVLATAASDTTIAKVTNVPLAALNAVATGTASSKPKAVTAPALTQDGLPRVLYVGAEYCPFCAAERWAFVVALSRFGTFKNLGQTASSPSDVFPSTATLTFHGATYTSSMVSLTAKEIQSNQVLNGSYAPLDPLSGADQQILTSYDAAPYFTSSGGIPFIDIGGKYLLSGASYDPAVLKGKTHQQIADALSDPTNAIAKAVDGSANLLTAAVCTLTNSAPASVCSTAGVTAAASSLRQS